MSARRAVPCWGVLATTLLATGCESRQAPLAFSTRDSADIRILTYRSIPDGFDVTRSVSAAHFTIGKAEGDEPYLLSRVVGGALLQSGVVVADGSAAELRRFDYAGIYLNGAGKRGGGPGEFELLRWMARTTGDSVVAWDLQNRRITYFDDRLHVDRTTPLDPPSTYVVVGVFEDGAVLVWPFGAMTGRQVPGQAVRDSVALAVALPGQESLDTIIRVPARPLWMDGSGELTRIPFTVDPAFVIVGAKVWAGNGTDGDIRRYDRAGAVDLILRLPPGEPIRDDDVAAFVGDDEERRRVVARVTVPERFPVYDHLLTGANGELWLRLYSPPDAAGSTWLMLDHDGRIVGRAELPIGEILDIRGNRVLRLFRDSLGIEAVALHEVDPS